MTWVGTLEQIYYDEIWFRLRNGWRVNIIFEKMVVNATLITEDGKVIEFGLDMKYSDYVESLMDMLDDFENHEIKLAMLMLLSYAPERKAKEKNWLDALMNIDFKKEEQPLKPEYKLYVRRWWSTREQTFDTVEFFKSIYNSITHKELTRAEKDTIMFAINILQKRGVFWHPEVNKWASKIIARLMVEKFSS